MAQAPRDQNQVTTLLGVSNVDGATPVVLWADPTTHRLLVSSSSSTNFADRETPTGLVNGVNQTFTLAHTPTAGSESVFYNGVLQDSGAGNDYTISSATITFLFVPESNSKIRVSYRY